MIQEVSLPRRTLEFDVWVGVSCANQAVQCCHELRHHATERPYRCLQADCECGSFVLS